MIEIQMREIMEKLLNQYNKEYDFLYDNNDNVAGYNDALNEYDKLIKNNNFRQWLQHFVNYRKDLLISDREVVAFIFACNELGLI